MEILKCPPDFKYASPDTPCNVKLSRDASL